MTTGATVNRGAAEAAVEGYGSDGHERGPRGRDTASLYLQVKSTPALNRASSSRSARVMRRMSSSKLVCGSQPRSRSAFE